jgi:hypothetical protein
MKIEYNVSYFSQPAFLGVAIQNLWCGFDDKFCFFINFQSSICDMLSPRLWKMTVPAVATPDRA